MVTMHVRCKYAFFVKKQQQHVPSDETGGYATDKRDVAGVAAGERGGTGRGAAQTFDSRGKPIPITVYKIRYRRRGCATGKCARVTRLS